MSSRKGISSVIATTLFIVIGVVAVGIIGGVIYQTINPSGLSPAFSCAEWKSLPPVTIEGACYSTLKKDVELQLTRGRDNYNLQELKLTGIFEGHTREWICGNQCGGCTLLEESQTKRYYFATDSMPSTVILSLEGCELARREVKECS